jgi:serine/threonine protein kinase
MALDTYGGLKTSVATWLNRPDLTSYIPDFIKLAEQRINYGGDGDFLSSPLRIPAMQTQATGTITSSVISFPTRFLEPIKITATSGSVSWSLVYVSPERFTELTNNASVPTSYTYLNNTIQTAGTGAASYAIDYYQAFASLSADADTNWVLANTPGIYLYAALVEAAPFLGDDPKLQLWSSMLNSSINAANRATKYQGGASLATRIVK